LSAISWTIFFHKIKNVHSAQNVTGKAPTYSVLAANKISKPLKSLGIAVGG